MKKKHSPFFSSKIKLGFDLLEKEARNFPFVKKILHARLSRDEIESSSSFGREERNFCYQYCHLYDSYASQVNSGIISIVDAFVFVHFPLGTRRSLTNSSLKWVTNGDEKKRCSLFYSFSPVVLF